MTLFDRDGANKIYFSLNISKKDFDLVVTITNVFIKVMKKEFLCHQPLLCKTLNPTRACRVEGKTHNDLGVDRMNYTFVILIENILIDSSGNYLFGEI